MDIEKMKKLVEQIEGLALIALNDSERNEQTSYPALKACADLRQELGMAEPTHEIDFNDRWIKEYL